MAQDPNKARTEGFERGLKGKTSSLTTQGWRDDSQAARAREKGYEEGKREKMRNEARKK